MVNPRFVKLIFAAGVAAFASATAFSQDYPNKTIRIIASAPGGGGDFTARLIAGGITGPLGQPVIVDNRGGGFIPAETLVKSPPDGYSFLVQGGSAWINPLLQKAPYVPERDFAPVILISRDVNVLAVHPSLPVKSVKELIALAKARPGELNYATGSTGSTTHLATELFKSMAGVNIVRVTYKGNAPAVTGAVSGEGQVIIMDAGLVIPHHKSGRLRALAATSLTPSTLAPGFPTVSESGVPGFESIGVTGLIAPAKTPAALITRINQEVLRFISRPEVKERFFSVGAEMLGSTPEQFADMMKSDIAKWSRIIKDIGITTE